MLYSFGWRLTWAVLPWSLVALAWLSLLPRARRLQQAGSAHQAGLACEVSLVSGSLARQGSEESEGSGAGAARAGQGEEPLYGGLTLFDKGVLGTLWLLCLLYSILSPHVLSKQVLRTTFPSGLETTFH